jgi:3'-phosphoadenosine 5'-phosphosulfate sulfotransferase (PAPS reductase)/FAD synthetase
MDITAATALNLKTHQITDAASYDHVVVMVSGGKDSAALMAYAVSTFRPDQLVAVHAVIDIDHKETVDVVRAQCAHMGIRLVEVQAVNNKGQKKGFISMMLAPRKNRKTGQIGQQMFPSMDCRTCTSDIKVAPCDKFVRTLKGRVLVLLGERAEESPDRAALDAWRPSEKLSVKGREVIKCSPILNLSEQDVWAISDAFQIPRHPCYAQGFSRASCAICIFSSDKEIALAAKYQTPVVAAYVQMERQLEHSFRYKPATKKTPAQRITVEDILKSEGAWDLVAGLV